MSLSSENPTKSLNEKSVIINKTEIHLRESDDNIFKWIGQEEVYRLLIASWLKIDEKDKLMNPVLVGLPGAGKTTLACAAANEYKLPIYIINCTSDMRPEDLIITPVISNDHKIIYRASALVSAMINGGVCVLDEANRMNEKSWASLAPLLDDRRYVESIIAGVKIKADPEFRLVATMNEDASTYNLPGYIESRLKPVVTVKTPTEKEIFDIIQLNIPYASKELLHSIIQYLKSVKDTDDTYEFSIRDAINITKYALKLQRKGEFNIEKAAQCIIHSAGAPHVW